MSAGGVLVLEVGRQRIIELDYAIGRTKSHTVATIAYRAQQISIHLFAEHKPNKQNQE